MEGTDVCTAANEPQPQDFEAGPEVAQISKEESLSFAASLKDPSDLDFLPKVASSGRLQKTHLGRRSTLLKFDPLLSELRPVYQSSGKWLSVAALRYAGRCSSEAQKIKLYFFYLLDQGRAKCI